MGYSIWKDKSAVMRIVLAAMVIMAAVILVVWSRTYGPGIEKLHEEYSETGYWDKDLNYIKYQKNTITGTALEKYLRMHLYTEKVVNIYHQYDKAVAQKTEINGDMYVGYTLATTAIKALTDKDTDIEEVLFFKNPILQARIAVKQHKGYMPQYKVPCLIVFALVMSIICFLVHMFLVRNGQDIKYNVKEGKQK